MDDCEGDAGNASNHQTLTDRAHLDTQSAHLKDLTKEPPIFKLMTEILQHVFLLNATDPDDYVPYRAATTMASSQVCTEWRSAALNYPMIWGHIIFYDEHSLRWIDELLRRSEPSLLDFGSRLQRISISDRHDDELGVLELVLNRVSRLRIFSLQATTVCWELVRARFLQQPAPNLELMNFCVLFDSGRILTGPNHLFYDHAPSLRSLTLHRCAVDFTSPVMIPLTELYVHEITALNAAPTVKSWLHLLGEMPSLRWITIIDAISISSRNETGFPTIPLAMLEMLRVDGVFYESVTLISRLITPPQCGLRVDCKHALLGPEQRILWAIIERKLNFWEKNNPGRRFIAKYYYEHSVVVGNVPSIDTEWDVNAEEVALYQPRLGPWPPLDPVLTIMLRSTGNVEDVAPLFLSLLTLFNYTFATTTHLTLWIDYEANNGTEVFLPLVDNFRFFVNLKSLDLVYGSRSFIFPLLQYISPSSSILLPALHALHLSEAYIQRDLGSLDQVSTFLRWRQEQGFPVQKVDSSWVFTGGTLA